MSGSKGIIKGRSDAQQQKTPTIPKIKTVGAAVTGVAHQEYKRGVDRRRRSSSRSINTSATASSSAAGACDACAADDE